MNNEIKEILDELDWYIKQPNNQDINGEYEPPMELSQEEAKNIYDYITNLQQENERLKKDNKILKQNNINEVLRNDFDMCVKDLKKANKKIEKLENYKSRIEKAIEWCECVVNAEKEGVYLPNGDFTDTGYCQVLAVPLLEILRGNDNE